MRAGAGSSRRRADHWCGLRPGEREGAVVRNLLDLGHLRILKLPSAAGRADGAVDVDLDDLKLARHAQPLLATGQVRAGVIRRAATDQLIAALYGKPVPRASGAEVAWGCASRPGRWCAGILPLRPR